MGVISVICFMLAAGDVYALSGKKDSAGKKKTKYVKSKYGLKALMDLSSGRDDMMRQFDRETKNYKKVREALEEGKIKHGDTADSVRLIAGEASLEMTGRAADTTSWIYKPGTSDFFSKDKITLIFGPDGELTGWESGGDVER